MQKIKLFIFSAIICCISTKSISQEKYLFPEGLALGGIHQYGREALYSDALAYKLYAGVVKPTAGETFINVDGSKKAVWTTMKPDSNGTFSGTALGSGYLYLRYISKKNQTAVLVATGHSMVYVNGVPHAGDMYRYGWMNIPVSLKKGMNEIYIRASGMGRYASVNARLEFPKKGISILTTDPTLPFLVQGESTGKMLAGLVLLNTTQQAESQLSIETTMEGIKTSTPLPALNAMMSRKVPVYFAAPGSVVKGSYAMQVKLFSGEKLVDSTSIAITAVNKGEHSSHTFISKMDGSVQYYAVAPQIIPTKNPSLYLSVHGAEVEAISQARAYAPKAAGPIVAPTNRRPRGFNWEDWGRLDAMEVLGIAKERYQPDSQRIYLTGHSMGGHGTWYLGATYPGMWAAIAPCAGYPTLADYGSHDGKVPTEGATAIKKMLIRASNPGNVISLAKNYKAGGVYVHHGDADPTVSVEYARQMRKVLAEFHPDFSYYEYPGGSHWFGNESVDWPPIFEYFNWHKIPVSVDANEIDFTTASVGISSTLHWVKVLQQEHAMLSKVNMKRDMKLKSIKGTTENIARIQIGLGDFKLSDTVKLEIDGQAIVHVNSSSTPLVLLKEGIRWMKSSVAPTFEKGTERNGGFKAAFNHNMVFVYGTKGTEEENAWMKNKATYDAETWYYRGNGAVDIIADVAFDSVKYAQRGIILFGNMTTNSAAAMLLRDCPVQVSRGVAQVGDQRWTGEDLGAYYVWPNAASTFSSIALIGGTGLKGMHAADANQYFAGGSGFPDYMIFSLDMLEKGDAGVKTTGFFTNKWTLGEDSAIQK